MKKCVAFLFLVVYTGFSFACSTFLLSKDGRHIFGRNLDWVTSNGMVMVNSRGVSKTSFMPGGVKTISWIARHGSITFNQFGKEFPYGGMNERGLVVELMWLNGTTYPAPDNRAALNELQWIQYQLDNCATIEEVIASDKTIRITNTETTPLHYLIADSTGKAATIEFINGKMVAHKGKELSYPVLTNTVYNEAVQRYDKEKGNGNVNYDDNSVKRFATACNMIRQFNTGTTTQDPIDYSFSILNKVSQGSYTKWSIVYDITKREVYYSINGQQQRKQFSFRDFDFSCTGTTLAINLSADNTGVVSKYFTPLSFDQNKLLIERSGRESRSRVNLSAASLTSAANYFRKIQCRQ
jgi:penicillin V acylase-like amidase (Ntn superfamily)